MKRNIILKKFPILSRDFLPILLIKIPDTIVDETLTIPTKLTNIFAVCSTSADT